jgi:hypothetical protein
MHHGIPQDLKLSVYHMVGMKESVLKIDNDWRGRLDRMYYNIILATDSRTIRSSSNVRIM